MDRTASLRSALLLALAVAAWASPAAALIVWKGRDGKSYSSAKDCFTANPACLPEQGRVAAPAGVRHEYHRDAPAAAPEAASMLCRARDGWMHVPPCDSAAGDATVSTPN